MNFLLYLFFVLFIIICLFLIMLVLIQKGRGGGLASAFGGGGGNTAFGSKTGDVLTWATSIVFGIFLILAISLNLVANAFNAARTGTAAVTPAGQRETTSLPKVPAEANGPAATPKTPPAE